MNFIKRHWFKLLMLLPFIPVGVLIYSLDNFAGIDESLLLLIMVVATAAALLLFFLSVYIEMSRGKLESKKIKFNIGHFKFGIAEIAKVVFSIVILTFVYVATDLAIMSVRLGNVVQTIAAPPAEVNIRRAYSLVTMADFEVDNQGSYGRIGVMPAVDDDINMAMNAFVDEQNYILNPIETPFDSPLEMITALYEGDITAMIISSNFVGTFEEMRGFENIGEETIVLRDFDIEIERTEREDIDPGEPFSILFLGLNQNDQALTSGAINVFMLLTVNLEELSFTITSIPRDSYVWIPCLSGYVYDKLSHTNLGGPTCAISTIEQMFDMEIPYYVMLNFTGFMSIIDVLGGIEVDVPFAFSEQNSRRQFGGNMIEVEAGLQRLNAEQALAFSRHRNSYGTSVMTGDDFTRVEHQQLVFEAMLSEMFNQVDDISDLLPMLEIIGEHVETNLDSRELMTIGQYMLGLLHRRRGTNLMNDVHFINMVITGHTERIQVRHFGRLYVSHPFQNRIEEARRLMMINLGLLEPDMMFNFAFNSFDMRRSALGVPNNNQTGDWINQPPAYTPPEEESTYVPTTPTPTPVEPNVPTYPDPPEEQYQPPVEQEPAPTPTPPEEPIDNQPPPPDEETPDQPVGGEEEPNEIENS